MWLQRPSPPPSPSPVEGEGTRWSPRGNICTAHYWLWWWVGWFLLSGCIGVATAGPVQDCQPCLFRAAAGVPDTFLVFQLRTLAGGERVVEEIVVQRAGQEVQRLHVPAMDPVLPDESFIFDEQDINFDGYNDLALAVARGVANTYALYWLFDPSRGRFTPVGRYPWLTVDATRKRLFAYERGGDGGMIYTATTYACTDNVLTVMRREHQERHPQGGYRKIIEERRHGRLQVVREQKVKPPR